MTTIVFDGKTLVVDSQSTQGTTICEHRNKISDIGDYWFVAAGDRHQIEAIKMFIIGVIEEPKIDIESAEALIVHKETGVAEIIPANFARYVMSPPIFMGSGADVARGAYQVCKDPIKALEVAIELDVYTGGQINKIEIQKPA